LAEAGPVKAVSGVSAVRWTGLVVVALLHLAVLKFLLDYRLLPVPAGLPSIFVDLIAPPPPAPPPKVEAPKPPPRKQVEPRPAPRQMIAEAPAVPTDYVVPEPSKQAEPAPVPQLAPVSVPQPAPKPTPAGPVRISAELALVCPERRAPAYPSVSRRMGEAGLVVLRVELSEAGLVARAQVEKSSGHARLDEAALAAVKTWQCNPATREGKPVRAIALQPFNFVLEGV